jgi:tight adherence protein C
MDILFLTISILIFGVFVILALGVSYHIKYRQGHWKLIKRIEKQGEDEIESEKKTNPFGVIQKDFMKIVSSLGKYVKPEREGELSYYKKTFLKAGYRNENPLLIFFGIKVFMAICLPLIFIFLKFSFIRTIPSLHFMFCSIALAVAGFYAPNLWIRNRISRRKEQILKGFPNALDLMVVCVEAGTGLDAAIHRVGEEMKLNNRVLSEEFKLLSLELRAGKSRRDALKNLSIRADLTDVSSLTTLLIQTEKFGTSIAQALRVYSDSMRTKRYQRAEELAAKLPVKLIFPLIIFIFPALFVTILAPAAIRIFKVLLPALG